MDEETIQHDLEELQQRLDMEAKSARAQSNIDKKARSAAAAAEPPDAARAMPESAREGEAANRTYFQVVEQDLAVVQRKFTDLAQAPPRALSQAVCDKCGIQDPLAV